MTVYITIPKEAEFGVRVLSIEGHSQVLPGESVAFPITETQGIIISKLISRDEELVVGDKAD